MIELKNLIKYYSLDAETIKAVYGVSFCFPDHKTISITGASGSGKSTLLHLIGGLDTPTTGSVVIDGSEITSMKQRELVLFRKKNIGFVFQFFNLIPELNVQENIEFARQIAKTERDMPYFDQIIDALGLRDRLKHLPHQLSGGQKQRVAIARALITKPKILLMDEPSGNLDSKTSAKMFETISVIRESFGQTIIVATHDTSLADKTDISLTMVDGCICDGLSGGKNE